MNKIYIPVILGTTREQRKSDKAARFIVDAGSEYSELETELIDPKDFHFLGDGNDPEGKDQKYSEITARADGFFIVCPEYNHSFSGSLKRMLDSEFENYQHKAVAFAGTSSGQWGGVRAIEALVLATREMGLLAISYDLHFPMVQDLFDSQGNLLEAKYLELTKKAWQELIWLSQLLKNAK
jgi:NAD(P)H-dependent FMN reductase